VVEAMIRLLYPAMQKGAFDPVRSTNDVGELAATIAGILPKPRHANDAALAAAYPGAVANVSELSLPGAFATT